MNFIAYRRWNEKRNCYDYYDHCPQFPEVPAGAVIEAFAFASAFRNAILDEAAGTLKARGLVDAAELLQKIKDD